MILKVGEHGITKIRVSGQSVKIVSISRYFNQPIYIEFDINVIFGNWEIICESTDDATKLLEYLDLMLLPEELRMLKLKTL